MNKKWEGHQSNGSFGQPKRGRNCKKITIWFFVKNDLYIVETLTKMKKENAKNHLDPCFFLPTYAALKIIIFKKKMLRLASITNDPVSMK